MYPTGSPSLTSSSVGFHLDSTTVEPSIAQLLQLLSRRREVEGSAILGRSIEEWRQLVRAELALPVDRPVVMAGHQPGVWHPGIVAKSLLAHRLTRAADGTEPGAAAHVVVEQDVQEVAGVEVPIRADDGRLARIVVAFLKQSPGVVAGALPPFEPAAPPTLRLALPAVAEGLRRIHAALAARQADQPNAAMQVTASAFDLLKPVMPPPALVRSSAVLLTSLGRRMLARMADDPESMARSYNAAVGEGGAATPLRILDDRVEIPLWRLDEQGRRLRAWDDDIERFEAGAVRLLPRALLMTGLLRLAACDLFIHGTGGVAYDNAMERWFAAWLGASVAPAALATATMRLDFPETARPGPDPTAAQQAWRHAWFDPALLDANGLGARGPSRAKQAHLARIEVLPRRSAERRRAWRSLHEDLAQARLRHEHELDRRRAAIEVARRHAAARPILESRSWPFPFFPDAALVELAGRLEA